GASRRSSSWTSRRRQEGMRSLRRGRKGFRTAAPPDARHGWTGRGRPTWLAAAYGTTSRRRFAEVKQFFLPSPNPESSRGRVPGGPQFLSFQVALWLPP